MSLSHAVFLSIFTSPALLVFITTDEQLQITSLILLSSAAQ